MNNAILGIRGETLATGSWWKVLTFSRIFLKLLWLWTIDIVIYLHTRIECFFFLLCSWRRQNSQWGPINAKPAVPSNFLRMSCNYNYLFRQIALIVFIVSYHTTRNIDIRRQMHWQRTIFVIPILKYLEIQDKDG